MIELTEQGQEQIVAAANLERDNYEAIERCRETATRTKKAVRCMIDAKARQDTRF